MKETESNPLYPSSFKPAYILPAPQLDVIKNFLERPLSVKTKQKQEARRKKINRKKLMGNLLTVLYSLTTKNVQ